MLCGARGESGKGDRRGCGRDYGRERKRKKPLVERAGMWAKLRKCRREG